MARVYFVVILMFCLVVSMRADDNDDDDDEEHECQSKWKNWRNQYNRKYKDEAEEQTRFGNFRNNWEFIKEHNEWADNLNSPNQPADLALNKFADMDSDTFKKTMLGFKPPEGWKSQRRFAKILLGSAGAGDLPKAVNWTAEGKVTSVKDQGQCGSCYTFSALGALEGQILIKDNKTVDLSEQQLVDCSRLYGNQGCQGGWMNSCFKYMINNRGVTSEKNYPYKARESFFCQFFSARRPAATMVSYEDIQPNEAALQAAVAKYGPISVAVDASRWQFYSGAKQPVFNDPKCTTQVNHAVLLTGYGTTEDGQDYWIIKNSWGTGWGLNGYMLLARGQNLCGVAEVASRPIYKQ